MNITWGLIAGGVSIMAVYRKEEGCCAVTDSGHVRVHLDAQTALLYRYQSPVNHAGFFTHSPVFPGQAHPCISFRTWSLAYAMMESRTSTRKPSTWQGGDGVDFVAVVDQVIALLRQRGPRDLSHPPAAVSARCGGLNRSPRRAALCPAGSIARTTRASCGQGTLGRPQQPLPPSRKTSTSPGQQTCRRRLHPPRTAVHS